MLAAAVPPQVKLTKDNSDYTQNSHAIPSRDLSQATVASESLSAFNDLKLSKRSKFIIFALSPEKTPIVVDKTSSDDD
ncbi:hypothetical protein OXX80_004142 [Metschnikowia pulcherrima]